MLPTLLLALLAPAQPPAPPPAEPGRLPSGINLPPGVVPAEEPPKTGAGRADPTVKLPQPEKLVRIDPSQLALRHVGAGWQLWCGPTMLRDFGSRGNDAQEMLSLLRAIRPTEWVAVGTPRTVAEYGLIKGVAEAHLVFARTQAPIDLESVRAEAVRGAWCLRDRRNILLNFGPDRAGAEQAAAAARRYGFNRVASIGSPNPVTAVLYASDSPAPASDSAGPLDTLRRVAQEQSLTRTAIDVPGVGLVGERVALDRGGLVVRPDKGGWTLCHGAEVLASFGPSELTARDALRVVRDGRYTEYCRVGGMAFFLADGKVPPRLPFGAAAARLDAPRLRAGQVNGQWALCDGTGRPLFPAASQEEAELMKRVAQAYGFDTICQVGPSPRNTLRYLAKQGR